MVPSSAHPAVCFIIFMSCLYIKPTRWGGHVRMTNTSTNLSLWSAAPRATTRRARHTACSCSGSVSFSPRIASLWHGLGAYMKVWFDFSAMSAREQVPVKLKSEGFFRSMEESAEERMCCSLQITSIWHEGGWRAEVAPCEEPTGNMLPATWQWHLGILFFAPLKGQTGLVWWSQGFWCLLCYQKMQCFAIIVPLRLL